MSDRRNQLEEWRKKRRQGKQQSNQGLLSNGGPKRRKKSPSSEHINKENTPVATKKNPNKQAVSDIRAKIAASARKSKKLLEERRKRARQEEQEQIFQARIEFAAKTPHQVQAKNLRHLVETEASIVSDLIKCCKMKEARVRLKQLYEDVPDCESIGEFWLCLADIERKIGNLHRARSVFAQGLLRTGDKSFRLACSEFMTSELLPGQQQMLVTDVNKLLVEPFAEQSPPQTPDKKQDEDVLAGFLEFNPHTTAKKSRVVIPGSIGKPARVPVFEIHEDERAEMDMSPLKLNKDDEPVGSFIDVAVVKSSKKCQGKLGSNVSMTPVRRSSRLKSSEKRNLKQTLKDTNFTYTPNRFVSYSKATIPEEDLTV